MDLKQILEQSPVKGFITLADRITAQNKSFVKNALGVNFSKNGMESIKLYYNWVHPLSRDEINALHIFGNTDAYYESLEKLRPEHFQPSMDFAYGVTFAIKIDKDGKISMAHFTMPDIEEDDVLFSNSLVKKYYDSQSEMPVNKRKGIFHLIDDKGRSHRKDYYYIHHPAFKDLINADYGLDIHLAPVVEWAVGKGFYSGSASDDEKINLLMNYHEIFKRYGLDPEWKEMETFTKHMWQSYKLNAYCPGFYRNGKVRSIYYFDVEHAASSYINTIPKLMHG